MDEVGVVGTRKSSSLEDLINKFFKTSLPSPEPPSLTIKYQEFRDQYGLTNAESELAASQNARLELENKIASEKGKIKSTSGLTRAYVQGELISIDAQTQDALNAVMRREQNAINSVNAKQRVISEVMQYTQQNYQNTSAQYDREFNRSIQMFSLLETIKDKEHDNALASFNAFQAATKDKEFKASPAMSAQFSQWDNQLGLPLGTSEGLATFARLEDNNSKFKYRWNI